MTYQRKFETIDWKTKKHEPEDMERNQCASLLDQEINFIGQLVVEFDQLAQYDDVLTAPEHLLSLATLFNDFMERIHRALKYLRLYEKTGNPPLKENDPLKNIQGDTFSSVFQDDTLTELGAFLNYRQKFPEIYPDKINAEELIQLFHQFTPAAENVARDLRELSRKLRENHAR
ncbi:MAG: hypothetical protein Kow0042_08930 [Calditrichia bacterium]